MVRRTTTFVLMILVVIASAAQEPAKVESYDLSACVHRRDDDGCSTDSKRIPGYAFHVSQRSNAEITVDMVRIASGTGKDDDISSIIRIDIDNAQMPTVTIRAG